MTEQTQVEILLKLRDEVSAGFAKLDTLVNKQRSSWVNFGAQIFVIEKAFRFLSAGIKAVVAESIKQEDAINHLNSALMLQGTFTEDLSKHYQDMAKTIQGTTRFADESVLELMGTLTTIGNIGPKSMERITQAALDFSVVTGRDLQSSAFALSKAAQGSVIEFSRLGIQFNKNATDAQNFEKILKFIEDKMGGRAQADVNSFGGQVAILTHNWSEFLEALGKFITMSDTMAEGFKKINSALENMITLVDTARNVMSKPESVESQTFFAAFLKQFAATGESKKILEDAMNKVSEQAGQEQFKGLSSKTIAGLGTATSRTGETFDVTLSEVDVTATHIDSLKEKIAKFRETTDKDLMEVVKAVDGLARKISDDIGGAFAKVIVEGGKLSDAFKSVLGNMLQSVIQFITSEAVMSLLSLLTGGLTGGSGFFRGVAKLFHFAEGVTNFSGGLAVVGERGPELVNLPRGSSVIPNDKAFGGSTVNVTIQNASFNRQGDVEMVFQQISDLINEKQRG